MCKTTSQTSFEKKKRKKRICRGHSDSLMAQNVCLMFVYHIYICLFPNIARNPILYEKIDQGVSTWIVLHLFFFILFLFVFAHQLNVIGKDCALKEPIYGTTFNFTTLRSDLGHHAKGEDDDFVEFNLCGNLTKPCAGSTSVAACFHHKGSEHRIGERRRADINGESRR